MHPKSALNQVHFKCQQKWHVNRKKIDMKVHFRRGKNRLPSIETTTKIF